MALLASSTGKGPEAFRQEAHVKIRILEDDKLPQRSFTLASDAPVLICRSSTTSKEAKIPSKHNAFIDSPTISRRHCSLTIGAYSGTLKIKDTKSLHGTWVNDKRIERGRLVDLHQGDIISLGRIDKEDKEGGNELYSCKTLVITWNLRPAAPLIDLVSPKPTPAMPTRTSLGDTARSTRGNEKLPSMSTRVYQVPDGSSDSEDCSDRDVMNIAVHEHKSSASNSRARPLSVSDIFDKSDGSSSPVSELDPDQGEEKDRNQSCGSDSVPPGGSSEIEQEVDFLGDESMERAAPEQHSVTFARVPDTYEDNERDESNAEDEDLDMIHPSRRRRNFQRRIISDDEDEMDHEMELGDDLQEIADASDDKDDELVEARERVGNQNLASAYDASSPGPSYDIAVEGRSPSYSLPSPRYSSNDVPGVNSASKASGLIAGSESSDSLGASGYHSDDYADSLYGEDGNDAPYAQSPSVTGHRPCLTNEHKGESEAETSQAFANPAKETAQQGNTSGNRHTDYSPVYNIFHHEHTFQGHTSQSPESPRTAKAYQSNASGFSYPESASSQSLTAPKNASWVTANASAYSAVHYPPYHPSGRGQAPYYPPRQYMSSYPLYSHSGPYSYEHLTPHQELPSAQTARPYPYSYCDHYASASSQPAPISKPQAASGKPPDLSRISISSIVDPPPPRGKDTEQANNKNGTTNTAAEGSSRLRQSTKGGEVEIISSAPEPTQQKSTASSQQSPAQRPSSADQVEATNSSESMTLRSGLTPPHKPAPQEPNDKTRDDNELSLILLEQQNRKRLMRARQGADAGTYVPLNENGGALADYQMQLMLQEQQNKKRIMESRERQEASDSLTSDNFVAADSDHSKKNPGLEEDYQSQLKTLEKENRKRPMMARIEDEFPASTASGDTATAELPQPKNGSALHDYHMQLDLLSQQNKARLRKAREDTETFVLFASDTSAVGEQAQTLSGGCSDNKAHPLRSGLKSQEKAPSDSPNMTQGASETVSSGNGQQTRSSTRSLEQQRKKFSPTSNQTSQQPSMGADHEYIKSRYNPFTAIPDHLETENIITTCGLNDSNTDNINNILEAFDFDSFINDVPTSRQSNPSSETKVGSTSAGDPVTEHRAQDSSPARDNPTLEADWEALDDARRHLATFTPKPCPASEYGAKNVDSPWVPVTSDKVYEPVQDFEEIVRSSNFRVDGDPDAYDNGDTSSGTGEVVRTDNDVVMSESAEMTFPGTAESKPEQGQQLEDESESTNLPRFDPSSTYRSASASPPSEYSALDVLSGAHGRGERNPSTKRRQDPDPEPQVGTERERPRKRLRFSLPTTDSSDTANAAVNTSANATSNSTTTPSSILTPTWTSVSSQPSPPTIPPTVPTPAQLFTDARRSANAKRSSHRSRKQSTASRVASMPTGAGTAGLPNQGPMQGGTGGFAANMRPFVLGALAGGVGVLGALMGLPESYF